MVENHLYLVPVKSNVAAIDLSPPCERKGFAPVAFFPSSITIAETWAFVFARVARRCPSRAHFAMRPRRGLFCGLFVSRRNVRHDYRKSRRNCGETGTPKRNNTVGVFYTSLWDIVSGLFHFHFLIFLFISRSHSIFSIVAIVMRE